MKIMKRPVSRFLAGLFAVLFFTTAASLGSICDNAPCEDLINIATGENFTLSLPSNAGSTGFEWWSQFDTQFLSLVDSSTQSGNEKTGMFGVPGEKLFVFSAQKPGSTDVIMLLLRPWENGTVGEKKIFPVNISSSI